MNAPRVKRKYVHSGQYSKKKKLANKEKKLGGVLFPNLVDPPRKKRTYVKSGKYKKKKPVTLRGTSRIMSLK